MTTNIAGPDPSEDCHKSQEAECFLGVVRDLAAFVRQHNLGKADAFLTELLAAFYARKS